LYLCIEITPCLRNNVHVHNEFLDDTTNPSALSDITRIALLLQQAAREEQDISYSELLLMLGFRFTRPKMRALCKTLDAIDSEAALRGEPALACLVVRESDHLPGQGWWVDRRDYKGPWEGAEARDYLNIQQRKAFRYWKGRPSHAA
jgi:hypothetical protein